MKAVITGDVIDSRKSENFDWVDSLKSVLSFYGAAPGDWEIFRGDSFQLMLDAEKAILAAFHIKAVMRSVASLDVRMGIGIGTVKYQAVKITESNGEAFVLSGGCFESLKKQTLGVKSTDASLNKALNIMLGLALLTVDGWSSTIGRVVSARIEHPEKNQQELAVFLQRSQSSISDALKRGGWDEIMLFEEYYREQISCL
ncbi:hypothetical protein BY457_10962 [Marinilabilia salmonicolor]|jgi:hypothetical protein|uniref:transcriptional regulator n=1 Tax=Marinilabilia salmonicolor TaxID=989 RepID=UPI000D07C880|nr:transcriptional regulator [Marinilabilia salmonicolor]PRY98794.1 hypothetical protein BY457_10962 [Marinilabilia salmonicolor]